jgi:large conductance mechanosensitive channel
MSILGEFKAFISKGNVMDLAVGVIIGGAFQTIVNSLVKDVITPIIGLFGGTPDFSNFAIHAHPLLDKAGKMVVDPNTGRVVLTGGIMVGSFLNNVVSFVILAAVVFFLLVKPMNRLMSAVNKPTPPPDAPAPPEDILLLRDIRDALKEGLPKASGPTTAAS